jgi:hypothetical protein
MLHFEDHSDWDKWLLYAIVVFNTTPHSSTGFTPHKFLFGIKPNIPGILQKETPVIQYTYDNYVKELHVRLQTSYELAMSNLQFKKEKSKGCHNRTVNVPLFVVGDTVLLHDETVRRGRSSKLTQSWIGPYQIISQGDVNVTLKLPGNRTLIVHANRLNPFLVKLSGQWNTNTGSSTRSY